MGLKSSWCKQVDGLIWISLSDNPPDFQEARSYISPEVYHLLKGDTLFTSELTEITLLFLQIKPHMLEKAKIAHVVDYTIKANWKLVYENNRDCYHCYVGHPEYIKANYDTVCFFSQRSF